MKVLVLGVSGMLGNTLLRYLAAQPALQVVGSARSASVRRFFAPAIADKIVAGTDVENPDSLTSLLARIRPDVVVNCIGLIKQLAEADDPLNAIPINALLPHRLARLCQMGGARLIHVSSDCVFAGAHGNYLETDRADADDLYGRSKYLGEVDYPQAITLRTSIIGHELQSANGLVGWFLAEQGRVRGFSKAIFSGVPTIELSQVIGDIVLPRPDLHGVYHVAAQPIDKLALLHLVAAAYQKHIEIVPDNTLVIDRSLNADRFHAATGYRPPAWPELVHKMSEFK